ASDMEDETGVGVGFDPVAEAGVPGAAGADAAAPGDRVVVHGAGAGCIARLVEAEQHGGGAARAAAEVVPLVLEGEALGQVCRRRRQQLAPQFGGLRRGMRMEPGTVAEQAAVPEPAVLAVGGGMDAHPAAAGFDPVGKGL